MVFPRNIPSQNSEKCEVKTTSATKESWCHWRLFDVENSALSLPKLENCVQIQLGWNCHWRQGVIIIDKPFLTLGWKSPAGRCIFALNYLLPNANFKRKMVINWYLRCLFGQKRVIVKILRLSCSRCLKQHTIKHWVHSWYPLDIFMVYHDTLPIEQFRCGIPNSSVLSPKGNAWWQHQTPLLLEGATLTHALCIWNLL